MSIPWPLTCFKTLLTIDEEDPGVRSLMYCHIHWRTQKASELCPIETSVGTRALIWPMWCLPPCFNEMRYSQMEPTDGVNPQFLVSALRTCNSHAFLLMLGWESIWSRRHQVAVSYGHHTQEAPLRSLHTTLYPSAASICWS